MSLKRGASYELDAELTMTRQRMGASFLIAAGAALTLIGVSVAVPSDPFVIWNVTASAPIRNARRAAAWW